MNPPCERFVPLIVRSADGTLAPDRRAELDAHVVSCAGCRAALAEQAAVSRLLARVDPVPAPADFAARVRARIAPQPSVFDLLNWRAWTLRLAPVAALLALLAWFPVTTNAADTSLSAVVDAWIGTQARPAGGVLDIGTGTSERDALLAAALGEEER